MLNIYVYISIFFKYTRYMDKLITSQLIMTSNIHTSPIHKIKTSPIQIWASGENKRESIRPVSLGNTAPKMVTSLSWTPKGGGVYFDMVQSFNDYQEEEWVA